MELQQERLEQDSGSPLRPRPAQTWPRIPFNSAKRPPRPQRPGCGGQEAGAAGPHSAWSGTPSWRSPRPGQGCSQVAAFPTRAPPDESSPFPAARPPFRPPPPEASVARVPAGAAPPRRLGPPPGPGRQPKPLPAAGPARPGGWIRAGLGQEQRAACGMAPTEGRVRGETGPPPRAPRDRRRGELGPRGPVVRPHIPNLVSKQLRRWNPPQGPREEALLPYPLPIRTPKLEAGRPSLPARGELQAQGPARAAASARPPPGFHRWQLRPGGACPLTPPKAGAPPGPGPAQGRAPLGAATERPGRGRGPVPACA